MSSKLQTAERVSHADQSDNYVFQRSLLAYHRASELVSGSVLEIGTGIGYGIDVIAPSATRFMTIDKFETNIDTSEIDNVEFHQMTVPPIDFPANSFDCVISFQVIEHIKDDVDFVAEVYRVLKPNGVFIVSTPNAPTTGSKNRRVEPLSRQLSMALAGIDLMGVTR